MARIRTFIAVPLDPGIVGRLNELRRSLAIRAPAVKWVSEDNFHVTLQFLGEVDQLEIVDLCRVVRQRAVKHPSFAVEVGGLGGFPHARRPKILWAGIGTGKSELVNLHADLDDALSEIGGYRRENRPYQPHVTLGRLSRTDEAEEWSDVLSEHRDWSAGTCLVDEICVMRSDLNRSGPSYSVLGRARLGKQRPVSGRRKAVPQTNDDSPEE